MLIPIVCNNIPTWDYWRRVLDAASLHQAPDPRSNGSVPHLVEGRTEDTVGSLGGDSEEAVSRLRDREVVGLQVRTIHEFGRFAGDAVVPKVHLELGDQVGSDDGEGGRVGAELGEEGLRLAHDGGGWKGLRWETLEENPQRLAREAGLGCTCASACRFESRSRLKCKSKTDGEYVGRN